GFGMPRYTLTSLAEELASRGYVVAAVDHANEAMGVEFPDGRMSTCRACETLEDQGAFALLVETRARDVSVLLDRLAAADAPAEQIANQPVGTRLLSEDELARTLG
ncbi:hypothetical protein KC219_21375, partial [Mycobacterium tuberculosis]|nr:hypothetical protein [Mycobacterium tuberculosis]